MSLENIPQDKLESLGNMAKHVVAMEKEMEMREMQLASLREEHKRYTEQKIPDVLMELGISDIRLTTGERLIMKPFYSASISAENQEQAFCWLRDHGHDSIIKNEIKGTFGKGEDQKVLEIMKIVAPLGFTCKPGVHFMTLKSFVKEQVESGSPIPAELFNLHVGNKITIK